MPDIAVIYENHHAAVRAYVRRRVCPDDVDDICGDIWLRVARTAASYRDKNPRAWLYTIAHSAIVDMHRRRSRRRECPLTVQALWTADAEALACERLRLLEAWQALTDDQRAILALMAAGYDLQAMAQRLGLGLNTLKSRQRRARGRLRQALEAAWYG